MDTPQISDNALDPELSPLHNPILAENLDRWARVYVAAPPEFRSRAIKDLVHDLQVENASRVPPREESFAPSFRSVEIACPQCGKIKEPEQKFCGFCGAEFPLRSQRPVPDADLAGAATVDPGPSLKPVQSVPYASRELDSLRELSFSTIYGAEESHHNGAKYAFVVLVILVCLGTLAFMQWKTQIRAAWQHVVAPAATSSSAQTNSAPAASPAPSTPEPASAASNQAGPENSSASSQPAASAVQPSAAQPANAQPQESAAADANGTSPATGSNQASDEPVPASKLASHTPARRPLIPAAKLEPVKAPASPAPPLDDGSEELSVAQRYLGGASGARDPAMAATWLWKAVSKQNPTALVLLSDLYAHGEGVSRNCDQARLLLVAAAKKGAPDAGLKLRNFENRGCQ